MKEITLAALETQLTVFLEKRYGSAIAKDCIEPLLYAEYRNKIGQGLAKLLNKKFPLSAEHPHSALNIAQTTSVSARVVAQNLPSYHVAQTAMRTCAELAQHSGIAVVGASGFNASVGALGFYVEKLAQQGLVAHCVARSSAQVAPFGSKNPLFGTNPLAWAFPTLKEPVVFDMTSSAVTFSYLVSQHLKGEKLPENVALDESGMPTIEPKSAMNGAILPFSESPKASGLSLMVELIAGPLTMGQGLVGENEDEAWGFFIMAHKPDLIVERSRYFESIQKICDHLAQLGITLPGEKGRAFETVIKNQQSIQLDDKVYDLLAGLHT